MCELLHAQSNVGSLSAIHPSNLLVPNQTGCGLIPHVNPILPSALLPVPVQPPLPQNCKSDKAPTPICPATPKTGCDVKSDTVTGLSGGTSLVNPEQKSVDPKSGSNRNQTDPVKGDHQTCSGGDTHNCGGSKPSQPASNPNPGTPVVVSGSGYGTTASAVIPVTPTTPVLPSTQRAPEHKESSKDNPDCGSNKVSLPCSKPEIPFAPTHPLTISQPPVHGQETRGGNEKGDRSDPKHFEPGSKGSSTKNYHNDTDHREDKHAACHPVAPVSCKPSVPSTPPVVTGSGYGTTVTTPVVVVTGSGYGTTV